jgi:hypothetical protein
MMNPVILTGNLPILPAVCFRCKCYSKKYFVDTGMDTEFDGRIYLCRDCLKDFVTAAPDMHTEADMLIQQLDTADTIKEAERAIRKYNNLVSVLKGIGLDIKAVLDREKKAQYNERNRTDRRIADGKAVVQGDHLESAGTDRESDVVDFPSEPDNPAVVIDHPTLELATNPFNFD